MVCLCGKLKIELIFYVIIGLVKQIKVGRYKGLIGAFRYNGLGIFSLD